MIRDRLRRILETRSLDVRQIKKKTDAIERLLLEESKIVEQPNFEAIRDSVLEVIFDEYDRHFFDDTLRASLEEKGEHISFRFSERMTRSAGTTTLRKPRGRRKQTTAGAYEIAISVVLLFQTFKANSRDATRKVAGLACTNRVEALQRVFEHELVHLVEIMTWGTSSCSRSRFQDIAKRLFNHREATHNLITVHETAATKFGIRSGDRVYFTHEGHTYQGIVNRITRRATVLVPDPKGRRYTDGERYAKFYIPLNQLRRAK